ncbi:MAG: glutathione S-transferase N-terminal domain-containing protein [bacterium]
MVINNRGRAIMALYSYPACVLSHQVRFVLAVKGITVEILDVERDNPPEDLLQLNPGTHEPTMVDRDLVLYDTRIICEYLDERYPHPPLMPVDPVTRARLRLAHSRVMQEWYSLAETIEHEDNVDEARKELQDSLTSSTELFSAQSHFMSDDFTLVDTALGPLLWRLRRFGISLPAEANPILDYAERLFEMESFQLSLSDVEKEMR